MDILQLKDGIRLLDDVDLIGYYSSCCGLYSVSCYLNEATVAQESNHKCHIIKEEMLRRMKKE